jgi:hypothetical protein
VAVTTKPDPFPLNSEELADVRSGLAEGCVYISMGKGPNHWCVLHADACDGHWHLHIQFRDREIEKTIPEAEIEAQLVEQLSIIKGWAFNAGTGVHKVLN